jgi:hypothetical protein
MTWNAHAPGLDPVVKLTMISSLAGHEPVICFDHLGQLTSPHPTTTVEASGNRPCPAS